MCMYECVLYIHRNECALIHWILLIEHFFHLRSLQRISLSLFSLGNNVYDYELLATFPHPPKEYAFALTDITLDYYLVSQHSHNS